MLSGSALRARRQELKLTQREVANIAGITESRISKLEHSETFDVTVSTAIRLAFALQTTVDDLIADSNNAPASAPFDGGPSVRVWAECLKHAGISREDVRQCYLGDVPEVQAAARSRIVAALAPRRVDFERPAVCDALIRATDE